MNFAKRFEDRAGNNLSKISKKKVNSGECNRKIIKISKNWQIEFIWEVLSCLLAFFQKFTKKIHLYAQKQSYWSTILLFCKNLSLFQIIF